MTRDAASFALALFQQRRQPPSGLQHSQPEIVPLAGIITRNITVRNLKAFAEKVCGPPDIMVFPETLRSFGSPAPPGQLSDRDQHWG